MSRIPILALPTLAVIIVVVFLIFIPPKDKPSDTSTVTPTAIVTEAPETYLCTRYNRNEGYTVDCVEQ
jgi:hypothetical protein